MDKQVAIKGTLDNAGSKQPDKSGIEYGLSSLSGFNSMDGGPSVDMTNDSKTGNYPGRIKTNPSESTVSSKGKSFNVC